MKLLTEKQRFYATCLIACAAASVFSGCASIAGEKTQPVSVTTVIDNQEVAGAGCTLANDAGKWFVTTPGSAMVHKSTGDMTIDCTKEDLAGHETLVSKSNGIVWGNIIAGGGIGYIIDRNTGAGFDYPNSTSVTLRKVTGASWAASAASSTVK